MTIILLATKVIKPNRTMVSFWGINICGHLEIVFEAFQIQNIPGTAVGTGKRAVQGIIIRKEQGYLLLKGIRQPSAGVRAIPSGSNS